MASLVAHAYDRDPLRAFAKKVKEEEEEEEKKLQNRRIGTLTPKLYLPRRQKKLGKG